MNNVLATMDMLITQAEQERDRADSVIYAAYLDGRLAALRDLRRRIK